MYQKTAMASAADPMIDCATRRMRRRSTMSARAPAGSARKSSGNVDDAAMSPTQSGEPESSSIAHDAATAWRKVPMLENTAAVHRARK